MSGRTDEKDIRQGVKQVRGVPTFAALALLLILSGCSIAYDKTEEEAMSEEIPNTVAMDVVHKVHKDGHLSLQLEAVRAETFDAKKTTVLTDAHFIEFNDKGEKATEGSGGKVVYHTDTEDAEISNTVRVHSTTEKGDVTAQALSWEHKKKILTAGPGERVVMHKDDGTSLSGIGFTGDFRRRQITFSSSVQGTYVWEKKEK